MIDTPTSPTKRAKGSFPFPSNLLIDPMITQSTKLCSTPCSPTWSQKGSLTPFSPFTYDMEGSDSVRSNTKMTHFPFHSTQGSFHKVKKVNVDESTLKTLGRLIEKRIKIPRESSENTNVESKRKFDTLSRSERKREAVVANINHYIKEKGLGSQRKEKDFNAKFQVFDKVNTFVDARHVFKVIAENKPKDNVSALKSSEETPLSPNKTTPFIQGSFSCAVNGFKSTQSPQTKPGKTKFFFETSLQPELKHKEGYQDPPLYSEFSKKRALNAQEMKDLKIRELYLQLKKNAISKFGPEIFENIQDKLNDPKCLHAVQMKRKKEIKALRDMKAELGEIATGEDLVEYLYNNEKKKEGSYEETAGNKFQSYLNKDLIENPYSQLHYHRSSSMPKLNFSEEMKDQSPKFEPNQAQEANEMSLNESQHEPQIRIFHEINDYQQKSGEIIKILRKKIVKASKDKANEKQSNRSLVESRETISNKFEPLNSPQRKFREQLTPLITKPQTKQTQQLKEKPSITKLHGNSTDFQNYARNTTGPFSAINKGYKMKDNNVSRESLPESLFRTTVIKNNTRSVSQDKFIELCYQLENATISNKELNKEMRMSMMKMEDPYSRHFNVLKQFGVPESLLNPKPKDFFKSTSKAALNLAAQSLKTRKI